MHEIEVTKYTRKVSISSIDYAWIQKDLNSDRWAVYCVFGPTWHFSQNGEWRMNNPLCKEDQYTLENAKQLLKTIKTKRRLDADTAAVNEVMTT